MEILSDDERMAVFKNALLHYKHRLKNLQNAEDNELIQDILKEHLGPKLQLIEEIIGYLEKEDVKYIYNQMDRYRHPICLALSLYMKDLEKSRNTINELDDISLNMKSINDELTTAEQISKGLCEAHLAFMKADKKSSSF